jgi:hypothetical protein
MRERGYFGKTEISPLILDNGEILKKYIDRTEIMLSLHDLLTSLMFRISLCKEIC